MIVPVAEVVVRRAPAAFLYLLTTTTTTMMSVALPPLPPLLPTQQETVLVQQRQQQERTTTTTSSTNTENYLPRLLYPGTYANYCGPTPEINAATGNCVAHGWHGDAPVNQVDAACQQHDVSYCNCESKLLSRRIKNNQQQEQEQQTSASSTKGLSSLVALRFATRTALHRTHIVDDEYLNCVHKADIHLTSTGIKIRAEQQRSNCMNNAGSGNDRDEDDPSASSSSSLQWFCNNNGNDRTLSAFEKVSLNIFLRDLDTDDDYDDRHQKHQNTFTRLEQKRHDDLLNALRQGKTISGASSSKDVEDDEQQMLQLLLQEQLEE